MTEDTSQLLKFSFITVVLIAGWFALASISKNVLIDSLLGWIGLGVLALFWRWLRRNKLRPPKL